MEIEFCGAAGEVAGSCYIQQTGEYTVLLDRGTIQGGRRYRLFPDSPPT